MTPPAHEPEAPTRRRTPVVLGVLSMVLGGLTTLTSLGGLLGRRAMKSATLAFGDLLGQLPRRPGDTSSPDQTMRRALEAQDSVWGYQLAASLGLAAFSVAVIFIGVGLYRRRAWARRAAIVWGVAALLFLPVMVWLQAFVVQAEVVRATMAPLSAAARDGAMLRTLSTVQIAAAALGTFTFYAPFPAALLGLMLRSSARRDFDPPA